MKIVLLGPPGAGKGTQAKVLSNHYGIPTISTGAMIRAEILAGSKLGIAAKKLMEEGLLVSDEVILEMLSIRLQADDCARGFILDGVPRTIAQAEEIETFASPDAAVNIEVSDDVIIKRLGGRRECTTCGLTYHVVNIPPKVEGICDKCGKPLTVRADDMPETIRKRLEVYHDQTEPLINFYKEKGKLFSFDGTKAIEETTAEIISALLEAKPS